ncbi:putative uncharacterized protein DDB_G0277255 [Musca domestica]|uniref:Uncharacterized protein n=1 Tax=Musca domestica TaxID=7370 RepID=A0A9J7CJQ4_MUSDO|nr:putative uncharacterized protein DDB_G0277255 [Musca domestica]XP_058978357.1 putative uncharacterized protein DDB_G0277255 [Musca domestica]
MYKTIRHGENSLQYTILPQNDDFRLEGKIKSAGSKKSKNKKPRRRSFFAYLGLLFVCTVIVGAVLVPFLVSAGLPNPTEWFQKTKAAFSRVSMPSSSTVTNKEHKENGPINSQHTGSALANAMLNKGNLMALNKANVGKPVKIINKDGVEKIILKLNKTSLQAADANLENKEITMAPMPESAIGTTLKEDSNQKITIHDLGEITNQPITTVQTQVIKQETTSKPMATTATAEVVLASTTSPALNRSIILNSVPNVPRASLQSSLNQSNNSTSSSSSSSSSTQPTMTTRIMQVPLLKSTAKKPAIPPVLVKNLSPIQPTPETNNYNNNNLNDIIPSKTLTANNKMSNTMTASTTTGQDSDWIHTHWPYIDPSTYFQWNGYKTEDSVLLPALLGFALIGVILIITVCLVARNKRTIVTSVRKRNRNDIEETGGEDNTTLLTNTNLSDED